MGGGPAGANAEGAGEADEFTVTPVPDKNKEPLHELSDAPKPMKKQTKLHGQDDKHAGKDDNEVTLALASIGKMIKKSLKEEEADAIIDKLNEVVGCHVCAVHGGVIMYQRQHTLHQPAQLKPLSQQQV